MVFLPFLVDVRMNNFSLLLHLAYYSDVQYTIFNWIVNAFYGGFYCSGLQYLIKMNYLNQRS